MDYQAEQNAIERRRRIAEMLMQQGAEPLETNQIAGGHVVPVSPLGAVSKIAQQLAGAYLGKKTDERASDLLTKQAGAISGIDFSAPDAPSKLVASGLGKEGIALATAIATQRAKKNMADPYYTPVETSAGLFKFNARTGEFAPMMEGDKRLMRSTSDPMQQAQITAAKEGQKGIEAEDQEGRKFRTTQAQANPQAFPDLIANLIQTESSGNPNAVSPKGAQGLTQIMPETAQNPGFGVEPMRDNSPDEQIRFGADYLRALNKHFNGDINKALSAYNAGPGTVEQKGITNPEYVDKVLKGPSLADKAAVNVQEAAAKETNKTQIENAAKLQQEKNERKAQGSRMFEMLTNPVDGAPIEDIIHTATGSGLGAVRDAASRIVGVSSPQAQAAAKLESLSGWLTSNVPRMQGPQSDRDVEMYRQMAGNLADRNTPAEEKLASYRAILEIAKRQAAAGNPDFAGFAQQADPIDDLVNQYLR